MYIAAFWTNVADRLVSQGELALATEVREFMKVVPRMQRKPRAIEPHSTREFGSHSDPERSRADRNGRDEELVR
jgi:hypothetical protein